jgi:hypothetical protein
VFSSLPSSRHITLGDGMVLLKNRVNSISHHHERMSFSPNTRMFVLKCLQTPSSPTKAMNKYTHP